MKLRVGVMRGGKGSEYHVSLKTGGHVLSALPPDRYDVRDILITADGQWHMNGVPTTPEKVSRSVDLVWNALHGEFGEDGKVQKILDAFGVPYTGSSAIPSAVGMNKVLAKRSFEELGIKSPQGVVVERGEEIEDVLARVRHLLRAPYVVKPVMGGSSLGLSFASNAQELMQGIERALSFGERALVEEYISGREITLGVIDALDNQGAYVTPPLEIFLPDGALFDHDSKNITPAHPVSLAQLCLADREALEQSVLLAHRGLGIRHYARYDVILANDGVYLLEVNTLPGLAFGSLFEKSLAAQGLFMPEFTDYIVALALQRK